MWICCILQRSNETWPVCWTKLLVGSVLAATLRLAMDDFWAAWVLFGIQHVFVVMLAIYPLMIMRCNLFELIETFFGIGLWKLWIFGGSLSIIEWNISFLWQFSMSGKRPYHKSCYKEQHHPRCDVCKIFVSVYHVLLFPLVDFVYNCRR